MQRLTEKNTLDMLYDCAVFRTGSGWEKYAHLPQLGGTNSAFAPHAACQLANSLIPSTLSFAMKIGKTLRMAKEKGLNTAGRICMAADRNFFAAQ